MQAKLLAICLCLCTMGTAQAATVSYTESFDFYYDAQGPDGPYPQYIPGFDKNLGTLTSATLNVWGDAWGEFYGFGGDGGTPVTASFQFHAGGRIGRNYFNHDDLGRSLAFGTQGALAVDLIHFEFTDVLDDLSSLSPDDPLADPLFALFGFWFNDMIVISGDPDLPYSPYLPYSLDETTTAVVYFTLEYTYTPVPEPSALAVLGVGILGLSMLANRKRQHGSLG